MNDDFRAAVRKINNFTKAVRDARRSWGNASDKLDTQHHLVESTLLEQTRLFGKLFLPWDAHTAGSKDEVVRDDVAPDGAMEMLSKD